MLSSIYGKFFLNIKYKKTFLFFLIVFFLISAFGEVKATPLYGVAPSGSAGSGAVQGADVPPNQPPSGAVPSSNGPGFNGPASGGMLAPGSAPSPDMGTPSGQVPGSPPSAPASSGSANGSQNPQSAAPTFMNSAMPNSSNPFLPNNISPGLLSQPLENAYLLDGVPQLAAPMMSAVYRPFGLTFFQPNPFQVTPQGSVSLTGYFETDTNINFSPNQPEMGSLYSITPAVMYSNFDDYGFLSLMASAGYYGYTTGNIAPYLDETGGFATGTYLGPRVFVGASDYVFNGSTPMMNGQPLAFFNGINSAYGNMADAELGVALTPKITFVEAASDQYFGDEGFGAGFMNLQSLMSTLNYMDYSNFLSASYVYQQGLMSDFPSFYSNGATGTAMRKINATTSLGVGGNIFYYFYQNLPTLNTIMYSYYGIFTHNLTRNTSFSGMGGWNAVVFQNGESFQSPEWDVNLGYSDAKFGIGVNAGEFIENMNSYGIEMGPEKVKMAMLYLSYAFTPKTSFFASAGYSSYDFLAPGGFSSPNNVFTGGYATNYFTTLLPNQSYSGSFLEQTDGLSYRPTNWLTTTLMYNLIDFTTNISNSVSNQSVIDNQFIALATFFWNFK